MNPRSPPLEAGAEYPRKRARHSPPESGNGNANANNGVKLGSPKSLLEDGGEAKGGAGEGPGGKSSNFRNVSACNRCRLRKNRCDQRLPSCASCEKANVKCVGYDPITKREIPRSYVYYLESRVGYLEALLQDHNIVFAPAEVLDHASRPGADPNAVQTPSDDGRPAYNVNDTATALAHKPTQQEVAWNKKKDESEKINKMVSNISNVSVQGASDSRYLGSTSGISFARVVFAAVRSSVPGGSGSDKSGVRPSRPPISSKAVGAGGTSMRDSFFGLHTKPTIKQAPFPDKDVGKRLVEFYFEHANPQIPILHRVEFMEMFELAYAEGDKRVRTPRELYMLNIVFAIGAGIFLGDSGVREKGDKTHNGDKEKTKRTAAGRQCQPEEYHASAIVHLESCLSSASTSEKADGFGGGLEELQAVLLLAGFALLRPVAPGLWYIIGVAVRLAVDLGLHYEDGKDVDVGIPESAEELKAEDAETARLQRERSARERGRREYIRDFRRRLWWCTYSFDRLVSTCVGRPFGITDQVVTTEFPSLLDDKYITPTGFKTPHNPDTEPTYKRAAYHYFRLRLLQSEILQVLQHQQAQQVRLGSTHERNPFMHTELPSPFLSRFENFRSWRIDIDKRLWEWKTSAPTKRDTGVGFSIEFLDLNYWQCIIMLYRQSLSTPPMFEGEFSTSEEVGSPSMHKLELREDEERVFLKVAEAGQRVLRLYRQLHRVHLVNYTFLATHHLFMAGISFLYAIWHSPIVRSRLTMDEVDFTILAATSVLGDLIEKCPPAEACRDAFDRMSKATVQMCMSTTGFSSSVQGLNSRRQSHNHPNQAQSESEYFAGNGNPAKFRRQPSTRPKPQFDMALNDLYAPSSSQSSTAGGTSNMNVPAPFRRPDSQNSPLTSSTTTKNEFEPYSTSATPSSMIPRQNTAPQAPMQSPSEYAISPPLSSLDTSSIDPSLLPSPQTYAKNPNSLPATQPNFAFDPAVFDFTFQNAPGMDFLNQGGNGLAGGEQGEGTFGDFGMGLGWDGGVGDGHDFSEGGNGGVDLFEGFFFGGAGNY